MVDYLLNYAVIFMASFAVFNGLLGPILKRRFNQMDERFLDEVFYDLTKAKEFCLRNSRPARPLRIYKKGFLFPRYKVSDFCPWGYSMFLKPNH